MYFPNTFQWLYCMASNNTVELDSPQETINCPCRHWNPTIFCANCNLTYNLLRYSIKQAYCNGTIVNIILQYATQTSMAHRLVLVLLLLMDVSLSTIVLGVSYIMGVKRADSEKASVYECGFDPFGSLN